jgi:hypothetical protein
MKTNPLNNIKVASPCPANWDEMLGNDRKRYCGECKLNVYNLSGMSKDEAENLIMNAEGRLCVRFFRRQDGTVLTKDCPVGWAKIKQRVSRVATATFSLFVGVFGGLFAFNSFKQNEANTMGSIAPVNANVTVGTNIKIEDEESCPPAIMGNMVEPTAEMGDYTVGRVEEVVGKPDIQIKPSKRKR